MNQKNFTFRSRLQLTEWKHNIRSAFTAGPVWIGRAGYGSSQYAMLNVPRWFNGEEVRVNLENNGLPASWIKALREIISDLSTP